MIWHKAEPGSMPEDILKKGSFKRMKLLGREMTATPHLLVIDKYCGTPGVMLRVRIGDGKWYWSNGPLFGHVIAWTEIVDPPFDHEAIAERKHECEKIWKK